MENVQDDGFNWARIIATLATIVLTSTALGWVLEQSIPHDGKESNYATHVRNKRMSVVNAAIEDVRNNPFIAGGRPWSHPLEILKTILLLPLALLRIYLLLITFAIMYFCVVLPGGLFTKQKFREDMPDVPYPCKGWPQQLINMLPPLIRVGLFLMGYHHIRVKGRRDPRAHIIVCNHVTFIDPIVLVSQFTPMFVAAAENLKKPGIGDFFRVTQGIPFDRSDRQSCISVARNIKERAKDGGFFPLLIFPEGTTTVNHVILQFKDGAFRPGLPVQPAIVRYSRTHNFDPSWTITGPSFAVLFLRHFFQFNNDVELEYLPLYEPNEEEKSDAQLFANNVRIKMSEAIPAVLTEHWMEDARLLDEAAKIGTKALKLERMTFHHVHGDLKKGMRDLLKTFAEMDKNGDGQVSFEEFKHIYGEKRASSYVKTLFSLMDTDNSGSIDFKEFLVGICLNDDSFPDEVSFEDKLKFCFDFYDLTGDEDVNKTEFLATFINANKGMSREEARQEVDKIFEKYDKNGDGVLQIDEFKQLLIDRPETYSYALPEMVQNAFKKAGARK